jgi:hypothetical protein
MTLAVVLVAPVFAAPTFVDVTGTAGLSYLQHTAQTPPNCVFSEPPFIAKQID